MSKRIQGCFPQLRAADFSITSTPDLTYNCIAWAAGEVDRWWWPDAAGLAYWPAGTQRQTSVASFMAAFATLGYETCDNDSLELGY